MVINYFKKDFKLSGEKTPTEVVRELELLSSQLETQADIKGDGNGQWERVFADRIDVCVRQIRAECRNMIKTKEVVKDVKSRTG